MVQKSVRKGQDEEVGQVESTRQIWIDGTRVMDAPVKVTGRVASRSATGARMRDREREESMAVMVRRGEGGMGGWATIIASRAWAVCTMGKGWKGQIRS